MNFLKAKNVQVKNDFAHFEGPKIKFLKFFDLKFSFGDIDLKLKGRYLQIFKKISVLFRKSKKGVNPGLGIRSFQKNVPFFPFFSVLL